jgi:DNA-binding NtrC family response regulator
VLNPLDVLPLDVLIVSERPDHLRPLIRVLDASSARVSACFTIRQAREIFSRQPVDLVFSDEYLSDGSYRELLLAGHFGQNQVSFVLLLRTGEWAEYLDAMRLGALDVLRCPLDAAEVEATALRAIALKEKRSAARLAAEALRTAASQLKLAQQDLLFEEFLGLAAAALAPQSSSASASTPKNGEYRPTAARSRGVV